MSPGHPPPQLNHLIMYFHSLVLLRLKSCLLLNRSCVTAHFLSLHRSTSYRLWNSIKQMKTSKLIEALDWLAECALNVCAAEKKKNQMAKSEQWRNHNNANHRSLPREPSAPSNLIFSLNFPIAFLSLSLSGSGRRVLEAKLPDGFIFHTRTHPVGTFPKRQYSPLVNPEFYLHGSRNN